MKKPKAGEGLPCPSFPEGSEVKACVIAEEQGPAPEDAITERIEEANTLYKKFLFHMAKGAALAFELGKILRDIWGRMEPVDSWPQFVEANFIFTPSTANRYIRVYENFKDDPKALKNLTFTGALKLLSAPRKEPEEVEYGQPDGQQELPWEQYFELPPLSRKAKLDNYRFEIPNGHEVYLIRRGFNYPVKIAEVLAPEDRRLKTAHKGMLENIQAALEEYYQEVERVEALEGGTK